MALVDELTVKETIYFFGQIFQMDFKKLQERYHMLMTLLDLSKGDQRVEECSGGEKRRVSFAAAMIHEPELLILDEPTVGLDPILREKIWSFMLNTTRSSKMTIIITTHYIEEARQADRCGLMRNGTLLAEDSPLNIMSRLEVDYLEKAFLKLCTKGEDSSVETFSIQPTYDLTESPADTKDQVSVEISKRKSFQWKTIKALLVKNILQTLRQPA